MKERQALDEDARAATKAAIEEGIVPGGGVALLNARRVLERTKFGGDGDAGAKVLFRALEVPARLIAENAGKDGAVVVSHILKGKDKNYGYNATGSSGGAASTCAAGRPRLPWGDRRN